MEVRDFMQAVGNNKQLLPTACIILCSRAQPYSFEHISYIVDKKKKKKFPIIIHTSFTLMNIIKAFSWLAVSRDFLRQYEEISPVPCSSALQQNCCCNQWWQWLNKWPFSSAMSSLNTKPFNNCFYAWF